MSNVRVPSVIDYNSRLCRAFRINMWRSWVSLADPKDPIQCPHIRFSPNRRLQFPHVLNLIYSLFSSVRILITLRCYGNIYISHRDMLKLALYGHQLLKYHSYSPIGRIDVTACVTLSVAPERRSIRRPQKSYPGTPRRIWKASLRSVFLGCSRVFSSRGAPSLAISHIE